VFCFLTSTAGTQKTQQTTRRGGDTPYATRVPRRRLKSLEKKTTNPNPEPEPESEPEPETEPKPPPPPPPVTRPLSLAPFAPVHAPPSFRQKGTPCQPGNCSTVSLWAQGLEGWVAPTNARWLPL
jgi:hypothetical protein